MIILIKGIIMVLMKPIHLEKLKLKGMEQGEKYWKYFKNPTILILKIY